MFPKMMLKWSFSDNILCVTFVRKIIFTFFFLIFHDPDFRDFSYFKIFKLNNSMAV